MALRKRGGVWYADAYVHGKRVRKAIGRSRAEAKAYLTELAEKDARDRLRLGPRTVVPDLAALFDRFVQVAETRLRPGSLDRYRDSIRSVRAFLARRHASTFLDLTPSLAEDFLAERAATVSRQTANSDLTVWKTALNDAVRAGLVPYNPIGLVRKLRVLSRRVPRFLSEGEVRRLLNAASPTLRPIFYTFLKTGLRLQELVSLRWEHVDLANGWIRVTADPETGQVPKSHQERTVPVDEDLSRLFAGLPHHGPYVFATLEGLPRKNNILNELKRAARRAGIEGLTVHGLRHTFASHLVMKGVDLPTVQALLGHAEITTTMIYAHVAKDHLAAAVRKLPLPRWDDLDGARPRIVRCRGAMGGTASGATPGA